MGVVGFGYECWTILFSFPQKLSNRTTSVPSLHSTSTLLVDSSTSTTVILNPSLISQSISLDSSCFLRAARDHRFPATAPIPTLFSHLYRIVDIGNRKRWIRGTVNDAERGAEMIYRGDWGIRFRKAKACGQETSWESTLYGERSKYISWSVREEGPC